MAEYARDEYLRVHSVHPDQQEGSGPAGAEVRMPGGRVGSKPRG